MGPISLHGADISLHHADIVADFCYKPLAIQMNLNEKFLVLLLLLISDLCLLCPHGLNWCQLLLSTEKGNIRNIKHHDAQTHTQVMLYHCIYSVIMGIKSYKYRLDKEAEGSTRNRNHTTCIEPKHKACGFYMASRVSMECRCLIPLAELSNRFRV